MHQKRKILLAVCALFTIACGVGEPSGEEIANRVPLGSKLHQITAYVDIQNMDAQVIAWLPRPAGAARPSSEREEAERSGEISNEFGDFRQRNLGSYDAWNASTAEKEQFTGEINVVSSPGGMELDIAVFYYVDGVLKKKDWGHLPG